MVCVAVELVESHIATKRHEICTLSLEGFVFNDCVRNRVAISNRYGSARYTIV